MAENEINDEYNNRENKNILKTKIISVIPETEEE